MREDETIRNEINDLHGNYNNNNLFLSDFLLFDIPKTIDDDERVCAWRKKSQ
jgi:hypothetical protein